MEMNSCGGNKCCISGCTNNEENCPPEKKFYRFPNCDDPVSSVQRSMWIEAIQNDSLNGPTWHPSESSVICSEHFLHKDSRDLSFVPNLFPVENTSETSTELQVAEKDQSCDASVLQKVVDRLAKSTVSGQGSVGTSQLQDAFREMACEVCRLLIAHNSELRIEGTVGVTVDGGSQVMLLHFADKVRKSEKSDLEESVKSEHSREDIVVRDEDANVAQHLPFSEHNDLRFRMLERSSLDGSVDRRMSLPLFTTSPSRCVASSSKLLSQLAQQSASMTPPNSATQSSTEDLPGCNKRMPEPVDSSNCDKSRKTLLRELLCSPLPPKRACRPVGRPAVAAGTVIGEVYRPRRPTANSTVLGGLLRTGNYQREPSMCPVNTYSRNVLPKYEPWSSAPAGYSTLPQGLDVKRSQCDGTAVRALLRFASKHATTGQHDLLRGNNKRVASAASLGESSTNDESTDEKPEQHFNLLYQNVCSNLGRISSEPLVTNENTARSDSGVTDSGSSEVDSVTVKQEVLDPTYQS